MLNKKRKFPLREHPDFFTTAKRLHVKYFTAWVLNADALQVGVIVPKKSATKATERNQLKRKLYAAWEELFVEYEKIPHTIVITVKPSAREATQQQLTDELRVVVQKIAEMGTQIAK